MAYVTARRNGRFEVRESLHTPKGPRARTLAGFDVLTDDVLRAAEQRATRPFDPAAVIASGRRAGARVEAASADRRAASSQSFVQSSRRMAKTLRRSRATQQGSPGEALIDLLGFADAVTRSQPGRPFEGLRFPVLSRLAEAHATVPAGAR